MSIKDQPAPKPNEKAAVWSLVIEDVKHSRAEEAAVDLVLTDMRERDLLGRSRYGTPLQAFNGRDVLVDLYDEALDGAVYARQAVEEGVVGASDLYRKALDLVFAIRYRMIARDAARAA